MGHVLHARGKPLGHDLYDKRNELGELGLALGRGVTPENILPDLVLGEDGVEKWDVIFRLVCVEGLLRMQR